MFEYFYLIAKYKLNYLTEMIRLVSSMLCKYWELPLQFLGKNIQDIVTSYRKSSPKHSTAGLETLGHCLPHS